MSRVRAGYLAALMLAVLTLGVLPAEPPPGKKLALLVGVKSYNHDDLPDLEYTERDVAELAELLRPAGYQVTLLTTTAGAGDGKLKPTAANIKRALEQLLANVTKHDTILVALAGHGVQPEGSRDSYFCPSDANPSQKRNDKTGRDELLKPDSLLSLNLVVEKMTDAGVGVKLLLVDACRNDPKARGGRGIDSGNAQALARGMAALFSCSAGQRSFETDRAGGGHGVFFHFVLEGLRGAAGNSDGVVTWSALAEYVQENVEAKVPAWIGGGARQVPHEVSDLQGRSPVLLSAKASAPKTDLGQTEIAVKNEMRNKIGMKLVRIKAGTFVMGSPAQEQDRGADETRHEVRLTRDFYLGKYPVTRGQFARFLQETGRPSEAEADRRGGLGYNENTGGLEAASQYNWKNPGFLQDDYHPVVNVTWNDAVAFRAWLSQKDGREYRLPTEAEWEYACRAGSTTRYFTGEADNSLQGYANVADQSMKEKIGRSFPNQAYFSFDDGHPFTSRVGTFKPNAFGLHDMVGNVWQWCADGYGPYDVKNGSDPLGANSESRRVLRGGSWSSYPRQCRSASRASLPPAQRTNFLGFRVAVTLQ